MQPLPVCRWRREPTEPGRFGCASPKIITHSRGVTDAQCRQCHCRDHEPPPPPRGRCVHLGPRVGAAPCPECTRNRGNVVELPLHACALHGRCTMALPSPGIACCAACPDWLSGAVRPEAGRVRHLTYFIYPFGPSWIWHLQALKDRLSLFNGRRVIAVATGPETATVAEVAAILGDNTAAVEGFDNDPNLKEMVAFPWLLESVSNLRGPDDVTLYGHAKGAGSEAWGDGVRRWSESMLTALLDYWPSVGRMLQTHMAVGCWKRINFPFPGDSSQWHYSGSWRWTRNADAYSREWHNINRCWFGSETYPSAIFRSEEAGNIYGEIAGREIALYLGAFWDQWAQGQVDQWRAEHAAERQAAVLATVILTAHKQADLVHEAIASVRAQTCGDWQLLIMDSGDLQRAGTYERYAADARINVVATGETADMRQNLGMQAWAINEAWARGLVRGDLVCHLSDDDILDPAIVGTWIAASRLYPEQGAWYGPVARQVYHGPGRVEDRGTLDTVGVLRPGNSGLCRIDGMQVVHRRKWRSPWPVEREVAPQADGVWIDRIAARCPIHPLTHVVGVHRHTPLSTFTADSTPGA